MTKKKPIIVTLIKGRHKTQPWTFTMDAPGPGPKDTVQERYARKDSARRGALRKLNAQRSPVTRDWYMNIGKTGNVRWIEFIVKTSKK